MFLKTINYNNGNIITDKIQIDLKLKELKIDGNTLREAVLAGALARNNSSPFDTKGKSGYIQWNDTNSTLRKYTKNKGWEMYQENGIEGIISDDKKYRIIPSSGNAATGNPNQPARNKNKKGSAGIKIIDNSVQMNLFEKTKDIEIIENETYVLLYYCDDKVVKYELSKPSYINTKGIITVWDKRYIFEKIDLNTLDIEESEEDIEEIDIPVLMKNNEV